MKSHISKKSREHIERRVIERINGEIGNDFGKLKSATKLIHEYQEQIQQINKELNLENDKGDDEADCNKSNLKYALEAHSHRNALYEAQIEKFQEFIKNLDGEINASQEIIGSVEPLLRKLNQVERFEFYLAYIQQIQNISLSLAEALNQSRLEEMTNIYLLLYDGNSDENSIWGQLSNMNVAFLSLYATRIAHQWHEKLIEKLSKEFLTVMRAMRWGQKEVDQPLAFAPSVDDIEKAQLLADNIYSLKSPLIEDGYDDIVTITPSITCDPLDTVVKLLLVPYRQRFTYHFMGLRQTNRLDKPEWYFTQILNWGKETHLFVGQTFQTVAIKSGLLNYNVRLEFLRGLVQLAIEKLALDIEDISKDENLFAHLLDEVLAFECDLRETFGYPASFPSVVSVVTQPLYLLKWITLEECFCASKMDYILQDKGAWLHIDPNVYDDDLKIPKCADQFMRLLEAIKERYYSLIRPGHQMQFLKLQLELIDNFRIRLVQLHSSGAVETVNILNALNYIIMVLREWGENVHYLHLHAALMGPNAKEITSVFDQAVNDLDHWRQELVHQLSSKAFTEVWAKSMAYRKDCWATLEEPKPQEPFILSPSAGEMFQVLVTTLHSLEHSLSLSNFTIILRLMAKKLDSYILDSMVLMNKFSTGGAAQFNYDMTRNLFPVFGQHIRRPDLLFKKIHDATKLLNAPRQKASDLYQKLKSPSNGEQEKAETIKSLGLLEFKTKACVEVLERRADLKILDINVF